MLRKITRKVLEGYLDCKYKAYLKLAGEQGTISEYAYPMFMKNELIQVKLPSLNLTLTKSFPSKSPLYPALFPNQQMVALRLTFESMPP